MSTKDTGVTGEKKSEHWSTTFNRCVVNSYRQRESEATSPESKAHWNGTANRAEREATETAKRHGRQAVSNREWAERWAEERYGGGDRREERMSIATFSHIAGQEYTIEKIAKIFRDMPQGKLVCAAMAAAMIEGFGSD